MLSKRILGLCLSLVLAVSSIPYIEVNAEAVVTEEEEGDKTLTVEDAEIKLITPVSTTKSPSVSTDKLRATKARANDIFQIKASGEDGLIFSSWSFNADSSDFCVSAYNAVTPTDSNWVKFADATEKDLSANPIYVKMSDSNITVTPVYEEGVYSVIFSPNLDSSITGDSNKFSGKMDDQVIKVATETELNENKFNYLYHSFKNWNTKADGSGDSYSDGAKVLALTLEPEITLYAQWNNYGFIKSSDGTTTSNAVYSIGTNSDGADVINYINGTNAYQIGISSSNGASANDIVTVYKLKSAININTNNNSNNNDNNDNSNNNNNSINVESYLQNNDNITQQMSYKMTGTNSNSSSSNKNNVSSSGDCELYKVTKFTDKTLEVPETVQIPKFTIDSNTGSVTVTNTTYTITAVSESAASGLNKVTKVKVGNKVKTIGKKAFSEMDDLKNVNISKKVKTIGKGAFRDNDKLKKVIAKSKVKKIKGSAFNGCGKLKDIEIKASGLTTDKIEGSSFSGIPSKANIKLKDIKSDKLKKFANRLLKVGVSKKATLNGKAITEYTEEDKDKDKKNSKNDNSSNNTTSNNGNSNSSNNSNSNVNNSSSNNNSSNSGVNETVNNYYEEKADTIDNNSGNSTKNK